MFIEIGGNTLISLDKLQYLTMRIAPNGNSASIIAVINNSNFQLDGTRLDIEAEYARIKKLIE